MKVAGGLAAALAAVCAAGSLANAAGSSATAVSRNIVVVSNTADVVNGDVSSVAALNAKPGRDGISLREALLAADKAGGSATVYIMFSPALNGKTIEPRTPLPPIHRDHLVLEGIAPNGSPARVTLDGRRVTKALNTISILLVQASQVTVRWLRFTGVIPYSDPVSQEYAVRVAPGPFAGQKAIPPGPRQIANVQIVDNVFDNSGYASASHAGADGVEVSGDPAGLNLRVSGFTVERNTFVNFGGGNGEAVGVLATAPGEKVQGVVIEDNTFDQDTLDIELATQSTARQTGAQIIGNTITGGTASGTPAGSPGITLDTATDGTLVANNTISDTQGPAINVSANAQIVNNVISANFTGLAGIDITGGSLTIENDTLVNEQLGTLLAAGAAAGTPIYVTIRNSILYDPPGWQPILETGPTPPHRPDVLTNSLTSESLTR